MSKKASDLWKKTEAEIVAFGAMLPIKYPKTFFPKDSIDTKPLAIGIRQSLVLDNPDVEWFVVSSALGRYVRKNRYLKALSTCPDRINLDGSISCPVDPKHRDYAISQLTERQSRLAKEVA